MAGGRVIARSVEAAVFVRAQPAETQGVWRQCYVSMAGRRCLRNVEATVYVSMAGKSSSQDVEAAVYVSIADRKKENQGLRRSSSLCEHSREE
jgi:hypothetical protein